MGWIVKPQFFGVKAAASNIGHGVGHYTADNFYVDYPQFFTPNGQFLGSMPMLEEIIKWQMPPSNRTNGWMDGGMPPGLYVAHYATRTCADMHRGTRHQRRPLRPGLWLAW